jgi:hypothetical protein
MFALSHLYNDVFGFCWVIGEFEALSEILPFVSKFSERCHASKSEGKDEGLLLSTNTGVLISP